MGKVHLLLYHEVLTILVSLFVVARIWWTCVNIWTATGSSLVTAVMLPAALSPLALLLP